jgi:5-methylcytosine-specific restriction endonuclease McrA
MPIKAENRARYPSRWAEIRAAILARAEDACEFCGRPNRVWTISGQDLWREDKAELEALARPGERLYRIVLTIAHIDDPDPANCAPENLKALCQRCHNQWDAPMRARNARATRRAGLVCRELFDHGG